MDGWKRGIFLLLMGVYEDEGWEEGYRFSSIWWRWKEMEWSGVE